MDTGLFLLEAHVTEQILACFGLAVLGPRKEFKGLLSANEFLNLYFHLLL
jgi:hypothetical protein